MPYFVYQISEGATNIVKNLEKIAEFEAYKEAKNHARDIRPDVVNESTQVRVVFADNALHAEELLMEKREKPIMAEWEK